MKSSPGFAVRRGRGIPLIFIHGFGVDHRLFIELDQVFDRIGGFERIYLDLPGFGRTPPDPGLLTLVDLASWVDEQVDIFSCNGSFALVGNSLGGLMARHAAASRLSRCLGMAFLAPVVQPDRARRTLPPRQVLTRNNQALEGVDEYIRHAYREMAVVESTEHLGTFIRTILPGIRSADADTLARLSGSYQLDTNFDQVWSAFIAPVLFICGRQDESVGYRDQFDLAERFPRGAYAVLDRAGHNLQIEQPELVSSLLAGWARQVLMDRTVI